MRNTRVENRAEWELNRLGVMRPHEVRSQANPQFLVEKESVSECA